MAANNDDYIKYFIPENTQMIFLFDEIGTAFFELVKGSGKLTDGEGECSAPDKLKPGESILMKFKVAFFHGAETSILKVRGSHSIRAAFVIAEKKKVDLFSTSFSKDGNFYKFVLGSQIQLQIFSDAETPSVSYSPITGFPEVFGATVYPCKHDIAPGSSVVLNSFCNWPYTVRVEGTNRRIHVIALNERYWRDTNKAPRNMCSTLQMAKVNYSILEQEIYTCFESPTILVTGFRNVGKTSFCYLLCNKALEATFHPVYVDLDVRGAPNTVSGTITFTEFGKQAIFDEGFQGKRIMFYFGSTNPERNYDLYHLLIREMGSMLLSYLKKYGDPYLHQGGAVIDICGTISHDFQIIKHICNCTRPSNLIVIADSRHYEELKCFIGRRVAATFIEKPTTIEDTNDDIEKKRPLNSIRSYFYGTIKKPLIPRELKVKFSSIEIYSTVFQTLKKIDRNASGIARIENIPIHRVTCDHSLLYHVLGVSSSMKVTKDKLKNSRVLLTEIKYLICIIGVDKEKGTLTVLSPVDENLSGSVLLAGELKWNDDKV